MPSKLLTKTNRRYLALLLSATMTWAVASVAQADPAAFRAQFQQYCMDCHGPDVQEGGLDLEKLLGEQPFVHRRDEWTRVAQVIELKAMPPEDSDELSDTDREEVANGILSAIDDYDYQSVASPGREPIRRLTNRQYDNTLRDLLGVDIRPAERFPKDLTGATGFANEATTLSLQPALMERYIAAAERTVDVAIPSDDPEDLPAKVVARLLQWRDPWKLDDEGAKEILRSFVQRAYRRPPEQVDVDAVLGLYQQARDAGANPLAAVKQTLPSVLVSPRFLMRIERSASDGSRNVDDWELATRLSYFLWSTMPDKELQELAAKGTLNNPQELRRQIDRMTADAKFREFGRTFGGEWLSTNLVGREIRRDPIDEPWCTDTLMDAMRYETELLLISLFRDNRPPTELLTADYTFVNEELAKTLYKLDDAPRGTRPRRVSLEDSGRRGILGHASVLAVTSNNAQTSPVKRGAYVLETILGTPPPPPPPDASELDAKIAKDKSLTFAEKLGRHAADSRCSSCHNRIDPLGQSLEEFGGFGRLRGKRDERRQMAQKTKLPDGTAAPGIDGLIDYLLRERREDYIRNLSVTLLEYALGRPLDYRDEQLVRELTERTINEDLGMRELLYAVVDSPAFKQIEQPPAIDHGN